MTGGNSTHDNIITLVTSENFVSYYETLLSRFVFIVIMILLEGAWPSAMSDKRVGQLPLDRGYLWLLENEADKKKNTVTSALWVKTFYSDWLWKQYIADQKEKN